MKTFRCSCSNIRVVEDNIIMVICKGCQRAMEVVEEKNEKCNCPTNLYKHLEEEEVDGENTIR